jgi:AcrR family transcriptional regulator
MEHDRRGRSKVRAAADPVAGGKRSGRRPGDSGTRDEILRAARRLFAENGYPKTTMRAVAREAQVDAALIHHFFVSKEGLFDAAVRDAFHPAELIDSVLDQGTENIGERLVRGLLEIWTDPETRDPMLAIVRSAVSYDEAADIIGNFVTSAAVGRIVTAVNAATNPELRATLIGSQLIGLVMLRYVIKVEPLASVDQDVLVRSIGPVIDRCLSADLDVPPAPQAGRARPRRTRQAASS